MSPKNKRLIVTASIVILVSAIVLLAVAERTPNQPAASNQTTQPAEEPPDQPETNPAPTKPEAEPVEAEEQPDPQPTVAPETPPDNEPEPAGPDKPVEPEAEAYLIFTGDEFNQLFNRVDLTNLAPLSDPPPITDDEEVDLRIRQIATDRGYRLRPMPADLDQLVVVEAERHRLQPEAAEAYEELKAAAAAEGLGIWLVSAYRSYDYQRPLFLKTLAAPYEDDLVFERLKLVAIPGYSKHHTGYTIDIAEGNLIFGDFAGSASYAWLSANNYENAKKHGWIPSYPPDAQNQGPDPEPWEFTYVGKQHLVAN